MPSAVFEPTIPAGEWPQTEALDRAATGTGFRVLYSLTFVNRPVNGPRTVWDTDGVASYITGASKALNAVMWWNFLPGSDKNWGIILQNGGNPSRGHTVHSCIVYGRVTDGSLYQSGYHIYRHTLRQLTGPIDILTCIPRALEHHTYFSTWRNITWTNVSAFRLAILFGVQEVTVFLRGSCPAHVVEGVEV
jgi:hypothetical protein